MRTRPLSAPRKAITRPAAPAASLKPRTRAGAALAGVLVIGMAGSLAMRQAPLPAAAAGGTCSPTITTTPFGTTIEPYTGKPAQVFQYTLTNCTGMQVKILNYGGIVQSIAVPDRHGHAADVVLGFQTLNEYVSQDSPPPPAPAARTSARPLAGMATGSPRAHSPSTATPTRCRSTTTATACTGDSSASATMCGRPRWCRAMAPSAFS